MTPEEIKSYIASKEGYEDVKLLRHAVGAFAGKRRRGYRNNYATEPDDPCWERLVKAGLAVRGRGIPGGLVHYHATEQGCIVAGLHPAAVKRAMER